ncbi:hypothetical protein [Aquimarina macrocephali]|uniref:hypothetical protein n=1 Tax=Aquimarina macrocephali TaxID=666563 RepID=UPI000465C9F4|nr:hypothetical protein [Aquimarina macrocephali]
MSNSNKPIFLGILSFLSLLTFILINYLDQRRSGDLILMLSGIFLLASIFISIFGVYLSYVIFKKDYKIKGILAIVLNLIVPVLLIILIITTLGDFIRQVS